MFFSTFNQCLIFFLSSLYFFLSVGWVAVPLAKLVAGFLATQPTSPHISLTPTKLALTMTNQLAPVLSVVSPCYNEADGLDEFIRQVSAVLDSLNLTSDGGGGWEIILVNDGSRDASLAIASAHADRDCRIRVVSFSRNFGHEAASTAGLRYARGDAVVLMDADLQDPPTVIPEMLAKWRDGYQIVYGVRSKRQEETVLKKATSWLFYRLLRKLADIDIPKDTGDFRLLDRRVVDAFNALPERNRFVRGLL